MTEQSLGARYRDYIACLNRQDWPSLGQFVSVDVVHNGHALGLDGYKAMLAKSFADIPDLCFRIGLLVVEQETVACRLLFDCTPKSTFLGVPVDGRHISFAEHAFYRFEGGRIRTVWSVIDRVAIEAQLAGQPQKGNDP